MNKKIKFFISLTAVTLLTSCLGDSGGGVGKAANNTPGTPGLNPAMIAIFPSPMTNPPSFVAGYSYGSNNIGTVIEKEFIVGIMGDYSATSVTAENLSAPFRFKGGAYPGTGGTCTSKIDTACTLMIEFAPTSAGSFNSQIILNYQDGKNTAAQRTYLALSGTGLAPADISFADVSNFDFGTRFINTVTEHSFTIKKTGDVAVSNVSAASLNIPFRYKGGSYPGTGGSCGSTINADCTIVVEYQPIAAGNISNTIQINFDGGSISKTISGTGLAPAVISISGSDYSYSNVVYGNVAEHTFNVTVTGSVSATSVTEVGLAAPFRFKGGAFPGTGGTCGTTINSNCTLVVEFAPTTAGSFSDTIQLNYNDGQQARSSSRGVSGIAQQPASLVLAGGDYSFTTTFINSLEEQTFLITKSGDIPATGVTGTVNSVPFRYKGGTYPGTGGTCGNTVNSNCSIVVEFNPILSGSFNSQVVINYNDGVQAKFTGNLVSGIAQNPAVLAISGNNYSYGNKLINEVAEHTFTITKSGDVPATSVNITGISAPFRFKDGSFPGTGGTCTNSISSDCTIVLEFAPTSAGNFNNTIQLGYNDGQIAQSTTKGISGTGQNPAVLTISGSDYSFASHLITTVSEHTFTITKSGDVPATSVNETTLAAPFRFKDGSFPGTGGTCSASVNTDCTLVVEFAPTTAGSFNQTITLNYNNGQIAQTASKGVSGIGLNPSTLSVNGGDFAFTPKVVGSVTENIFTINKTGDVAATSVLETTLASPFRYKGGTFPGTGGTCTTSINADCTLVVEFVPTVNGNFTSGLHINYNDGLQAQAALNTITASAQSAAILSLSDGPTYNFGNNFVNSVSEHTFTITKTGEVPATFINESSLALPFRFKGGSFPGTGGTCTNSITADCTIVVEYNPTTSGSASGTITINYNDGLQNTSTSVGLSGNAQNTSVLAISGSDYSFGSHLITTVSEHTFTITKSGDVPATSVNETTLALPYRFKNGSFPGTGGTCTSTINSDCTIVLEYAPTSAGSSNGTITLSYNNGQQVLTAAKGVSGTALNPATLSIAGGNYSFGSKVIGSTTEHTFTVNKAGDVNATGVSAVAISSPFRFKGGSFPGTGGTCSATIGANCTVVVEYVPTVAGPANNNLQINYNDGLQAQSTSISISGTALTPATLSISDSPTYSYGNNFINTVAEHSFTISRTGDVNATSVSATAISLPFRYKGGSFPGTGGTCTSTISSDCTIIIEFNPTASGSSTKTVTINYNNGIQAQAVSIDVTGAGQTPAVLSLSDGPTYNFGTKFINTTTDHTLVVTKTGDVSASISSTSINSSFYFKDGTYPGTGGTCGATISSNCIIVISFTPLSSASFNGNIQLTYNNGQIPNQTTGINLAGVGQTPAILSISDGDEYNFGEVYNGQSADKLFSITNNGDIDAINISADTPTSPFAYTDDAYPGINGTCGTTITKGETCYVEITFQPVSSAIFTGTFTLNYENGQSSTSSNRALRGTGVKPANITIDSGSTYDFGTVDQNVNVDHTFTLNNNGDVPATDLTGFGLAAPFSFIGGTYPGTDGTCGNSLSSGASCTINVRFVATMQGTYNDELEISYLNNGTGDTILGNRSVTGTAKPTPGTLSISDGPKYNFGYKAPTKIIEHTFTVTKNGDFDATQVTPVALVSPFSFKDGTYPGTGGTCTDTITTPCTIVVVFDSGLIGDYNSTLELDYHNGVISTSVTRAIEGHSINTISAGYYHLCNILDAGNTKCWGYNAYGQLALGNTLARGDNANEMGTNLPAVNFGTNRTANIITSGSYHNCSILDDNSLKCWGRNSSGQLGIGSTVTKGDNAGEMGDSLPVVNLGTNRTAKKISAGDTFTCAILDDNSSKCWGNNTYGQLGLNNTTARTSPFTTAINLGTNRTATTISTGLRHSCAILDNNDTKCWGYNNRGQLGIGSTLNIGDNANEMGDTLAVTNMGTNRYAKFIASGDYHNCAILDDNTVKCWGYNSTGQLGIGSTVAKGDNANEMGDNLAVANMGTNRTAKYLSLGSAHSCALLDNNTVKCWGRNNYGQLGIGSTASIGDGANEMGNNLNAVNLGTNRTALSIKAGAYNTCALLDDFTVKCWGYNAYGQIGIGTTVTPNNAIGDGANEMGDLLQPIGL